MSIQHGQLRPSPHATYYGSFFLLRTAVVVNGQLAEIDYSTDGELTLSCRYPSVSVSLCSITANLGAALKNFGVSAVTHFYCEQAPLFQVCFSSEEELKKFLQAREMVETELASLLFATLPEQFRKANPKVLEDIPIVTQAEVFLIQPNAVQREAQVIKVTMENYAECMALWKESEMLDFNSLFRVYRMDHSKIPNKGAVTIKALVTELHDVVNWFSLGIILDVPEPELKKIRADHREKTDACKMAVLSLWLRNGPAKPTWSAVVKALVGIKMNSLARKIALKYGVAVPTSVEATPLHELPFLTQRTTPFQTNIHTTIRQLSEEVEEKEQKLMRVTQSLLQAQAEKATASRRRAYCKHTLAASHNKTWKIFKEKKELQLQLKMKMKELKFLQLLPEQQQENEELRTIIDHKNFEVRELQEKLQLVEEELQSVREEAHSLREKLHQTTTELIDKSARMQELERTRSELRGDLERERMRVDHLLMQSAAAINMKEFSKEIQLQLSCMQLESEATNVELEQHREAVAWKEDEIQRLSEQVQALEIQLQDVQNQHSQALSMAELELEEQRQKLTVETSELRVQLAEAEGERQKAVREMEAVSKQKDKLLKLIAELEAKGSSTHERPLLQHATEVIQYRALYDFDARDSMEVSFQEGDFLTLCPGAAVSPRWVMVEVRGERGLAPENYLQQVKGGEDVGSVEGGGEKRGNTDQHQKGAEVQLYHYQDQIELPMAGHQMYIDPTTYTSTTDAVQEFAKEIQPKNIRLEEEIGAGEFGMVYRGIWKESGKTTAIAVKTLKPSFSAKLREDFLIEASTMGQFNHTNIVKLYGVVTKVEPLMIIMEFMDNCSLYYYLKNNDEKLGNYRLVKMARGVASGMQYLSTVGYVHRVWSDQPEHSPVTSSDCTPSVNAHHMSASDIQVMPLGYDLTARNVLVSREEVCKVTGFELCRKTVEDEYNVRKGGKIAVRWTAPEAIFYRKFTSSSDVWSFGVLLWEVMSYAQQPYKEWDNQTVLDELEAGYRLQKPKDCPNSVYRLMLECWNGDHTKRPAFKQVVAMMDMLLESNMSII